MKIEFTYLNIRNFKAIREAQVKLDRVAGLHYVRGENLTEPRLGSNGAGKSSLFDAMSWCMFGKTPGGLRNPDILPWGSDKNTSPSVTLLGKKDGVGFALVRTSNPNSINLDDKYSGQEDIDAFFGFNFDLFTNTIMLAQGQPLFFDLPPKGKMDLFTDVLELDNWEERSEKAKGSAEETFRKVTSAESQLIGLRSELESVTELLQKNAERSAEWKEEQKVKREKVKVDIEEHTTRLKEVQSKYDEAAVQYDSASLELRALADNRKKVYDKLREAERAYDKQAHILVTAGREIEELQRALDKLEVTKVCPTCGQTVQKKDLKQHKATLEAKLKECSKDKTIPQDIQLAFTSAKKAYEISEQAEKDFEAKAKVWREPYERYGPEVARTQTQVNILTDTLEKLDQERNPYRDQAADLEDRQSLLTTDIRDAGDYINRMRAKAERLKYWVQGFKDIRLFIIEDVLQELELASNVILEELGLIGWSIKYDIEKETKSGTIQRGINVAIESPTTSSPVKWGSWSGGEGQRLRLIGALALSEVLLSYAGVSTNIEVLDEPTRHLSKEGIRDTWRYLADRADRLDRVCLYVDHQFAESARFTSVIVVSKTEEGSVVTEE